MSIRRALVRHMGVKHPPGDASSGPTEPRSDTMPNETGGFIKSGLFISLDGVIEAPETWHFPYFDEQMGAAVGSLMAGNDAMLLGRRTYDEFAGYWPSADPSDPITGAMNGSRKYVVSS